MNPTEIPLVGGHTTTGVLRIGNTVRRPVSANSALAHDLLCHAEKEEFGGVPRFLGIDEQGREILSFLSGEVPRDLGFVSDNALVAAAKLLRSFHDMSAGFTAQSCLRAEVICHNDWGPPNTVFRDGLPCGIIDFDAAAPGLRLWDLGYSAFAWLDLGNSEYSGSEQIRRLELFLEGYGEPGISVAEVAAYAVVRQTALAVSGRVNGNSGTRAWAAEAADWTVVNILERVLPTGYGLTVRS